MIAIYACTFSFAIYNIIMFLVKQRRYKNALVSIFYALSLMVLAFRMCYYIAVIDLYTELNEYRYTFTSHVRPSYFAAYIEMYNTGRHIAILFTCADY